MADFFPRPFELKEVNRLRWFFCVCFWAVCYCCQRRWRWQWCCCTFCFVDTCRIDLCGIPISPFFVPFLPASRVYVYVFIKTESNASLCSINPMRFVSTVLLLIVFFFNFIENTCKSHSVFAQLTVILFRDISGYIIPANPCFKRTIATCHRK